jgi:signal transduction histidine kinase
MKDRDGFGTSSGSLRRRLLLGAALWITAALLVSGVLIAWLLTGAVETQVYGGLTSEVDRLVAAIKVTPDSRIEVDPVPPQPEFAQPYSGRYWQVVSPGGGVVRSRSLWDGVLKLPEDVLLDGELHRHRGAGPDGRTLILLERAVVPIGLEQPVRVVVAVNREWVTEVTRPAIITLAMALLLLALGLVVAAWLQVSAGLRPLGRLQQAVASIATGRRDALGSGWPVEVTPLARELDRVLSANRRMVESARRQAADLAHALKTRLAVAANETDALTQVEPDAAQRLAEELAAARRLLDRHLARVRAGGGATRVHKRVPAAEVVGRVIDAVDRLSDRSLTIERRLADEGVFLGDRADLEEIAGNLLDNAVKWAVSQVRVALTFAGKQLELTVEDDGRGIPQSERSRVLDPGVRLDERAPGSGLGLTIVGELVAAYDGRVELRESALGGGWSRSVYLRTGPKPIRDRAPPSRVLGCRPAGPSPAPALRAHAPPPGTDFGTLAGL